VAAPLAMCLLVCIGGLLVPQDPHDTDREGISPPKQQRETTVRPLLANGDGHNWLSLSRREKLDLSRLCAETTKRHSAAIFYDFLEAFYREARENDPSLLSKQISEIAAVGAALDLEE
jgi:hypothetical protein